MESPIVAEKRRREMKSIFFCIASHNFVFIVHGNCISEFVLEAKEQRDTEKLFGQKKRRCSSREYAFMFLQVFNQLHVFNNT